MPMEEVHDPASFGTKPLPPDPIVITLREFSRGQLGPNPLDQPEDPVGVVLVPPGEGLVEMRRVHGVHPESVRAHVRHEFEPPFVGAVIGWKLRRMLAGKSGADVDALDPERTPFALGRHFEDAVPGSRVGAERGGPGDGGQWRCGRPVGDIAQARQVRGRERIGGESTGRLAEVAARPVEIAGSVGRHATPGEGVVVAGEALEGTGKVRPGRAHLPFPQGGVAKAGAGARVVRTTGGDEAEGRRRRVHLAGAVEDPSPVERCRQSRGEGHTICTPGRLGPGRAGKGTAREAQHDSEKWRAGTRRDSHK